MRAQPSRSVARRPRPSRARPRPGSRGHLASGGSAGFGATPVAPDTRSRRPARGAAARLADQELTKRSAGSGCCATSTAAPAMLTTDPTSRSGSSRAAVHRAGPDLEPKAVPVVLVDDPASDVAAFTAATTASSSWYVRAFRFSPASHVGGALLAVAGDHGADDRREVGVERRDRDLAFPLRLCEVEDRGGQSRAARASGSQTRLPTRSATPTHSPLGERSPARNLRSTEVGAGEQPCSSRFISSGEFSVR